MYLDETKLTITQLKAMMRLLGMSSATRLTKRSEIARAIEAYVNK